MHLISPESELPSCWAAGVESGEGGGAASGRPLAVSTERGWVGLEGKTQNVALGENCVDMGRGRKPTTWTKPTSLVLSPAWEQVWTPFLSLSLLFHSDLFGRRKSISSTFSLSSVLDLRRGVALRERPAASELLRDESPALQPQVRLLKRGIGANNAYRIH